MADGPAAGWYPDPEDSTQQRYWDGQQWTEHRAPIAGAGQQPASPQWGDQPQPGQPQPGQQQWGGQPQWPGQPAYGGAGGQPQQNQKALWSMILGILGIVCCGLFTGIPALILGNQAKREIDASGGAQTGAGMAQAGFILGIISIVLSIIGILIWTTIGFAEFSTM